METASTRDPAAVRAMFDSIAPRYDVANHLLSGGIDFWWRHRAAEMVRAWQPQCVLDLGTGSLRVDPNVEHAHHHLVCTSCGRVRDLPVEFDGLRVPNRYRHDFTIDAVQVIFRGRCDDCA